MDSIFSDFSCGFFPRTSLSSVSVHTAWQGECVFIVVSDFLDDSRHCVRLISLRNDWISVTTISSGTDGGVAQTMDPSLPLLLNSR